MQKLLLGEWAISATTDALIALTLLFFIWKLRATNTDRVYVSTNKVLERIVVLTINTGVWTAICSLFSIVAVSLTLVNVMFICNIHPKLYCRRQPLKKHLLLPR